jgi:hypothetical protein
MHVRLAFASFVCVGIASVLMLAVLQCSSTKTIVRDKATAAELRRVEYSGGSGDSYESAVVIQRVRDRRVGAAAEYQYISNRYGTQNKKWRIVEQAEGTEGERIYDMVQFEVVATGEKKILYFDVTAFARKKKAAPAEE